MSRAKGERLGSVWDSLCTEDLANIRTQLTQDLKEMRHFTATSPQKVDVSPLNDILIGDCQRRRAPTCTKIGSTMSQWFDSLLPTLSRGMAPKIDTTEPHNNNSETIESKLQELKDEFLSIPEGPCVLTHGDLNLSNIMVKDDKITAIIDWEHAGFYPWWAERWLIERWGGESDVLFDPIWDELHPQMDEDRFAKEIFDKVRKVENVWAYCLNYTEHPGWADGWLLLPFC